MNVHVPVTKDELQREIQHLTRPVWRAATFAVCLIVLWGVAWRIIHIEFKHQEPDRAHYAR